jgi:cytochrome c-type biogenesis protein CcmE
MNRVFWSLLLGFVVIGGLAVFQATRSSTSLIFKPSELVARTALAAEPVERVRLAGKVVDSSITYRLEPTIELRFEVHDPGTAAGEPGKTVQVVYNDLKPDMFAGGRDVLVDGEFRDGLLRAHTLQTQCPSKYEPAQPGAAKERDAVSPAS